MIQKTYFYIFTVLFFISTNLQLYSSQSSCACYTFIVTSNKDTNSPGTLRHAINKINQSHFQITPLIYFLLDGNQIIKLKAKLPTIAKPVTMDGCSSSQDSLTRSIAIVGNHQVTAAITVDQNCVGKCSFSNIDFYNVEYPNQPSGILTVDENERVTSNSLLNSRNTPNFYGATNLYAYEEETKQYSCCCGLLTWNKKLTIQ